MSLLPLDRTMLGAPRKIRGVRLAIVVDNKDGNGNPGYRVKVKFPWLNDQETSFWARIAVPMGGPDRGTYVLPEIDDQVLVVFEHGDIDRPIVVGALWSKKQEPVETHQSGKNNTKLIKSRSGHRLIFDDKEGAEKVVIVDKTNKNKIVLDSVEKLVKIESDGAIEIKAKTSIVLHSNALKIGTREAITGKAGSLRTHAQKAFSLEATGGITIGGGNTTINVSSGAATSVSGSGAGELGGGNSDAGTGGGSGGGGGGAESSLASGAGGGPDTPGGPVNQGLGSPPAPPASPVAPVDEDQIVVCVVNARGKPQRDIDFTLTLPDGSQKVGFTAGDGCLRFSGLTTRGACKLELSDFDTDDPRPAAATAGALQCRKGGIRVSIGQESTVELPPRVYRGRLLGMLFDTDKVFLLPQSMGGMRELVEYYAEHPDEEVLVVGHTDSQGPDDYNVRLSVERARAIAEFLTDDAAGWLKRYRAMSVSQTWGVVEDQGMLQVVKNPARQPYRSDSPTGELDDETRVQIGSFQADNGLPVTGSPNGATREQLIERYMATEGTSLPPGTKLQIHGCGPFHPAVDSPPGEPEQRNRRVEVFFFEDKIDPSPRARCPQGGCDEHQRWVDRIVENIDIGLAPGGLDVLVVDPQGAPLGEAQVHIVGHSLRDATTDAGGAAPLRDVIAGDYRVTAERIGFDGARADAVTVVPGSITTVTLVLQLAWRADWDRQAGDARMLESRDMVLTAPGLTAGAPVTFTVTQIGVGAIGKVDVTSEDGRATAPWDDWFAPERVSARVHLQAGQRFAAVQFSFVADAAGISVPGAGPLAYADRLDARIDAPLVLPSGTAADYILYSPYGTRRGTTDPDGNLQESELPPGGVSVVFVQQVLIAQ